MKILSWGIHLENYLFKFFQLQEFHKNWNTHNFFTWNNILELFIAVTLVYLCFKVDNKLQQKIALKKTSINHLLSRIIPNLTLPLLLFITSFIAAYLWFIGSHDLPIWLKLVFIAAPWLALIRSVIALIGYIFKKESFSSSTQTTLSVIFWLLFLAWISNFYEPIIDGLKQITFSIGNNKINLWSIIAGISWSIIIIIVALWIARLIEVRLMKLQHMNLNTRMVLNKLIKSLSVLLAILIVLPMVGIDLTVLSVFGGALGIGLGFGLQQIASNYISGFIILLDKSVHLGDKILLSNFNGYIKNITARFVVIKNSRGSEALVPNSYFLSNTVINESYMDPSIQQIINFTVYYDTDINQALAIMLNIAQQKEKENKLSLPRVYIANFSTIGIELQLNYWVNNNEETIRLINSELLLSIWKDFKQAKIIFASLQKEYDLNNQSSYEYSKKL